MEGEAASEAENNTQKREDAGGDNSNENNNNGSSSKIVNSNEGQSKPKRQMKTPFQLETLEKAYACKCVLQFLEILRFFVFSVIFFF